MICWLRCAPTCVRRDQIIDRRTFMEVELEAEGQSRVGKKLTELTIRKVRCVGCRRRSCRLAATCCARCSSSSAASPSFSWSCLCAPDLPQLETPACFQLNCLLAMASAAGHRHGAARNVCHACV